MLIVMSAACFAQSQSRNCGTMEHLEMTKKTDPTLQQRMDADEIKTQEWIQKHTVAKPVYPAIEGFTPTGNDAIDRLNYAKAKEIYLEMHPSVTAAPVMKTEQTHARKKQVNSFTRK